MSEPFGATRAEQILSRKYRRSASVVPSDAATLESMDALFVDKGGTLVLRLEGDAEDWTLTAVPDNSLLAFAIVAVRQTGTTATDLRALYVGGR